MPKTVSVYLEDQDVRLLDRLAKAERRSRSAMVSEIIRRYAQLAEAEGLDQHPLFRTFSSRQLAGFLKEDRALSSKEASSYRKLLGLP